VKLYSAAPAASLLSLREMYSTSSVLKNINFEKSTSHHQLQNAT
jgi:hypothetical protein